MPHPIILLDLNYTLVENSREVMKSPSVYDISVERYRTWLIDLIRNHYVILITARPHRLREETLAHLRAATGWEPNEAYFNERRVKAPLAKETALLNHVFPGHGTPGTTRYLALESNKDTAAMYAGHGIPSRRQSEIEADPSPLG
jgi:hypothetical protein